MNLDIIRKDFPILHQNVNGNPLIYLDNSATTHKPNIVVQALQDFYFKTNSNVHRGVHHLSQIATDQEEEARRKVRDFIHAKSTNEILFTKGTTDSLNLIAHSLGKFCLKENDEIILSEMEHHSNIVPWQIIAKETKSKIKTWKVQKEGNLNIEDLKKIINPNTKIISITWVSNSFGTINPIREIIQIAKENNIFIVVDAAQSIQHKVIDVQELDIDFLAFSGHKIYGPTGIGVLYGKEELLNQLPPYQGGGSMIKEVFMDYATYNESPFRFEAGTPHIGGIIGLGYALDYVNKIGMKNIAAHETELIEYAESQLSELEDITIYAKDLKKAGAISFNFKNTHPFDVGELLNMQGVAVRTGHHCCQPLMRAFNIPGTIRASFGLYNTKAEVDQFIIALKKSLKMLG